MEMSITSDQFTVYSHDQGCRVTRVRVSSSTFNTRERLLQNNSCAHSLDDSTNQDKMNNGTEYDQHITTTFKLIQVTQREC
jgi:hypothetical protein